MSKGNKQLEKVPLCLAVRRTSCEASVGLCCIAAADIPAHNVHCHCGEEKESCSEELGGDIANSRL